MSGNGRTLLRPSLLKPATVFDDFFNRPYYHIVLDYYNIIEKTQDNRMVVLKKKNNIQSIHIQLIEKYELIKE